MAKVVWRNEKERKQWARRLQSANPGLDVVHPEAAGVDIGNSREHADLIKFLLLTDEDAEAHDKYVSSAYCQEPWAHANSSGPFSSVHTLSFLHDSGALPTGPALANFDDARRYYPSDVSVIDILSDACRPPLENHHNLYGSA